MDIEAVILSDNATVRRVLGLNATQEALGADPPHPILQQYFTNPENVRECLTIMLDPNEGADEVNDAEGVRVWQTAGTLLTCRIPDVFSAFRTDPRLFENLFAGIGDDGIAPRLTGLFPLVFDRLMAFEEEALLVALGSHPNVLNNIVDHLDNSACLLVAKTILLGCHSPEAQTFLVNSGILGRLVGLIARDSGGAPATTSTSVSSTSSTSQEDDGGAASGLSSDAPTPPDESSGSNGGALNWGDAQVGDVMHASPHLDGALHLVECLCEALSEAEGELSDHPAAAHLVSDRVIAELMGPLFRDPLSLTSFSAAVSALTAIVRIDSSEPTPNVTRHFARFVALVAAPPSGAEPSRVGGLGAVRYSLIRLIGLLVDDASVEDDLVGSDYIGLVFDLCTQHPEHNALHSVFVNTLATVLMGGTKTMAESVVTATRLQDRILAVVASTGGGGGVARPAFFGHLWQIAELLNENATTGPMLADEEAWVAFMDGPHHDFNAINATPIADADNLPPPEERNRDVAREERDIRRAIEASLAAINGGDDTAADDPNFGLTPEEAQIQRALALSLGVPEAVEAGSEGSGSASGSDSSTGSGSSSDGGGGSYSSSSSSDGVNGGGGGGDDDDEPMPDGVDELQALLGRTRRDFAEHMRMHKELGVAMAEEQERLEGRVVMLEAELGTARKDLDETRAEHSAHVESARSRVDELELLLNAASNDLVAVRNDREALRRELATTIKKGAQARRSLSSSRALEMVGISLVSALAASIACYFAWRRKA